MKTKRENGTVYTWVHSAGWGFAKPASRHFDVFVHRDKIVEGASLVRVGSEIEIEMGHDLKRPYAKSIKVMS